MKIITDDNYWDCDCEKHYIHRKSDELICPVCGAHEDDGYPDSRLNEIEEGIHFFKKEYNRC